MSLAFLIGVFAGLRGLTPPAVAAWALYLGWLHVDGMLSYLGATAAVVLLTLLAAGELVGDKLPTTPSRTAPPGLIAGTFGGFQVRTGLVRALGVPDVVVALLEDALTIAGSLWVVTHA